MVISEKNKFLFIHIYKTGGTSIRNAIEKFGEKEKMQGRHGHATARDGLVYLKEEGLDPDNITKFCVVRNPWKWHQSLYLWIRNNHHPDKVLFNKMSFDDYVYWLKSVGSKRGKYLKDGSWIPNVPPFHTFSEYIKDEKDNIIVDKILKIEEIKEGFPKLLDELGLPKVILSRNNVGSYNMPTNYTKETIKIIEELHKEDLEILNYSAPSI